MRACPRCRTPYPFEVRYCPRDGADLGDDPPQTSQADGGLDDDEHTERGSPPLPVAEKLSVAGRPGYIGPVTTPDGLIPPSPAPRPASDGEIDTAAARPGAPRPDRTDPEEASDDLLPVAATVASPAGSFTVRGTPGGPMPAVRAAGNSGLKSGPQRTVEADAPRVKGGGARRVSPVAGTVAADKPPAAEEAAPAAQTDENIGTKLGNYVITRPLGVGGMGAVYIAEHATIGKKAAAKLMHRNLRFTDEAIIRFQQEAMAAAAIGHDNIVEVFDFGRTDDGDAFILMEYLAGRSLASILEQDGPLAPERLVPIVRQMCEGLEAAHRQGIIHRDLKPDNIFLAKRAGKRDVVKLLDFGIAKLTSLDADLAKKPLTQTGMLVGTPQYMSPEQCEGRGIDSRSDIYSLGVILFELLTGEIPFKAETLGQLMLAHVSAAPPPFSEMNGNVQVGPAVERVVHKALVKSAEGRFQSARELAVAFRKAVRSDMESAVGRAGEDPLERTALGRPDDDLEADDDGPDGVPGHVVPVPVHKPRAPTTANVRTALAEAPPATRGLVIGLVVGALVLSATAIGTFIYLGARSADNATTSSSRDDRRDRGTRGDRGDDDETASKTASDDEVIATAPAEPPETIIVLASEPPGAEVFLRRGDRRETYIGRAPFTRPLSGAAGETVTLVARAEGRADTEMVIALAPGERVERSFALAAVDGGKGKPATSKPAARVSTTTRPPKKAGRIAPPKPRPPDRGSSSGGVDRPTRTSPPPTVRVYTDDSPGSGAGSGSGTMPRPRPKPGSKPKKSLKAGGLSDPFDK